MKKVVPTKHSQISVNLKVLKKEFETDLKNIQTEFLFQNVQFTDVGESKKVGSLRGLNTGLERMVMLAPQ